MDLNDYEWQWVQRLSKARTTNEGTPPVPSLIMAAYRLGDGAYRNCLEAGFPGIGAAYARRWKSTTVFKIEWTCESGCRGNCTRHCRGRIPRDLAQPGRFHLPAPTRSARSSGASR